MRPPTLITQARWLPKIVRNSVSTAFSDWFWCNPGRTCLTPIASILALLSLPYPSCNPNLAMELLEDSLSSNDSSSPAISSRQRSRSPTSVRTVSRNLSFPATTDRFRPMSRSAGLSQGHNSSTPSSASVSFLLPHALTV